MYCALAKFHLFLRWRHILPFPLSLLRWRLTTSYQNKNDQNGIFFGLVYNLSIYIPQASSHNPDHNLDHHTSTFSFVIIRRNRDHRSIITRCTFSFVIFRRNLDHRWIITLSTFSFVIIRWRSMLLSLGRHG
ncbi:hypothetical protein AtNW77_Chr1g0026971 [Arabidopsis thaliana]